MRRLDAFRLLVACAVAAVVPSGMAAQPRASRPLVGVALGGGSARGFAHVGVLHWFEEHHVPVDLVAGTSMGGLIGGAYAAGMSSSELAELLARTDWDELFGAETLLGPAMIGYSIGSGARRLYVGFGSVFR